MDSEPFDSGTSAVGRPARPRSLLLLPILAVGLLWVYWPPLVEMVGRWSHDPRYSHGYLVPAFAAYLLWFRRGMLAAAPLKPSWWGVPLILAGGALNLAGGRYYVNWYEAISILPTLAGISLLFGGWPVLRWAWPAIGFLFFMIPLPHRAEMALGYPLQRIATLSSNYALQTVGLPAVAEGNIIHLDDDVKIGVVEACNGLGMLFTFFAFTTGVALVIQRGLVDKALIVLSAIPIALLANVIRIVVTGILHQTAGSEVADAVYHDLAGWLMMPMALGALWVELWLLSHLFLERVPDHRPIPIVLAPGAGAGPLLDRPPRRR